MSPWFAADPAELSACLRAQPIAVLHGAIAVGKAGRVPTAESTRLAAEVVPSLLTSPPAEIRLALEELLLTDEVGLGLQWLHEVGALGRLLPELAATVDFDDEVGRRHKDVWEHTKQVVRQAVAHADVRWAALLHDIGKVPTRTITPDGKIHFHGHAEVGARMFDGIARRFGFDKPQRAKVRFLILHHLRANQYAASWTDSAVRRFDREMGEHLVDLLDLSRADITSRRPGRRQSLLEQIDALAKRVADLRALDAIKPPLPSGLGNAICARFAIPPSRLIGDLKRALEEACERGELEERREDEYYLAWLEDKGLAKKPES
jgi:poly(A) polymerase